MEPQQTSPIVRSPRTVRAGMTLLELMIVLVILVMLIAIAGPRLLGTQKKADARMAKVQIGNFESALKDYYAEMRSYPSTEDGLKALLRRPDDENKAKRWGGPYLDVEVLPADPWGNAYGYEYPPSKGRSDKPNIFSAGPDGEAETDDDIVNWVGGDSADSGDDDLDSLDALDAVDSLDESPVGGLNE